jgi:hypothetical protein
MRDPAAGKAGLLARHNMNPIRHDRSRMALRHPQTRYESRIAGS